MTHPCSVMVSEERAVRGERRVEPSPEGPWDEAHTCHSEERSDEESPDGPRDASQPRLWCSRGILRLAPADLRSLRMTGNVDGPPSLDGSVSPHVAPPRRRAGMLPMTYLPLVTLSERPRAASRRVPRCLRCGEPKVRVWCSRGILRLAPADRPSLRMTGNVDVPPSPHGSVSPHVAPPRTDLRVLSMTVKALVMRGASLRRVAVQSPCPLDAAAVRCPGRGSPSLNLSRFADTVHCR